MSAETIPADVLALARSVVSGIAADAGMSRRADAVMLGDMDDGPEITAAIRAILADRSTRPAEPASEVSWHSDDLAVDRFAAAMKVKLAEARAKGKGGWYDETACSQQYLSDELRRHVLKPDPLDVANFAMFLHQRGEEIAPAPEVEVGGGLLADTGCTSLDDLRDKAAIGVSLMERIADLCKPGSRHEHWAPADDPAEIVFDLANEADDLRRERDEARADRGTIAAEADHWKAKAADLETAIAVGRSQIQSRENGLVFQRDRERAEVKRLTELVGDLSRKEVETRTQLERKSWDLSRALQDRDEAVRVAVEDEREACARIADAAGQAAAISADRKQATSQSGTSVLTGYVFAKTEAEAIARDIRARRARLRADQRAGDGATPSVKQEQADRGYGLGFTRGMTAEQLDEAERHCLAMFDQRGDHGGSPGEYWAEALMEIETARARRAGDGGAA